MKKYYAFVAGKSGGHILPCIANAKEIYLHNSSAEIVFFTTANALDKKIISGYPFIKHIIYLPLQSINFATWWKFPLYFCRIISSLINSLIILWKLRPVSLTSMGGFISIPVCFAATILRIPITIFELNVEPGKAVSVLAPLATHLNVCFEQTKKYFPKYKSEKVDYPVRFGKDVKKITKEQARTHLKLDLYKKTIFILGGSQGSLFLNHLIKQWFIDMMIDNSRLNQSIQIIHQIGIKETVEWQEWYNSLGLRAITFTYNESIEYCYQAADIIICRAGAGTLFEILWFDKKCICIPLQTTTTAHQIENARVMQQLYPDNIMILNQHEIQNNFVLFYQKLQTIITNP